MQYATISSLLVLQFFSLNKLRYSFFSWEITNVIQQQTIQGEEQMMRRTIKRLTCMTLFFFLLVPLAFAESEFVEGWVGTWTVKMSDNSKVTWEITDTWVSESGKSHIAYGVKNPGTVLNFRFITAFFLRNIIILRQAMTKRSTTCHRTLPNILSWFQLMTSKHLPLSRANIP